MLNLQDILIVLWMLKNIPDLISTPAFLPLELRKRIKVIILGKVSLRLRVKCETDCLRAGLMDLGMRLIILLQ